MKLCSPFYGFLSLFMVVLGASGCYHPQRDLALDPRNNPLVHILEARYDPALGAVRIRWEHIGDRPVETFRILRSKRLDANFSDPFRSIGLVDGNQISPSYITLGSFQDADLLSGEPLQYRVVADYVEGGSSQTILSEVSIPGAQIRGVNRDPSNLAVQVLWRPSGEGVQAYEVLRRVGDGQDEVVFRTEDPQVDSFWDRSVVGNERHTYRVRSTFGGGVKLDSTPVIAQFYSQIYHREIETFSDPRERMLLASGSSLIGGSFLALLGRVNQTSLIQFRFQIGVTFGGSPRVLRSLIAAAFVPIDGVLPASLGLAGPSLFNTSSFTPEFFVGGISPATGKVVVQGFTLPQLQRVWTGPPDWQVGAVEGKVVLTVDASNRLWAAVGNEIRVFSENHVQVGKVGLNQANPADLLVVGDRVWVAWPEHGMVEQGIAQFSGGILLDLLWQDPVPVGTRPVALTQNRLGQVFALDGAEQAVRLLDSEGSVVLRIQLPNGNYEVGDLAIEASGGNLLHVSDSSGRVVTFSP
ncbi:MAG: hypothetical protein O7G87_12100 [bacterium]|nr:hypothetical protein [bacterium]